MSSITLPDAFAHLAPFTRWCLATETERNTLRNTSSMADILAFKDAMLLEVDAIVAWLDRHPIDALPDEDKPLMYLLLSLAEVGPAVEFYKQPAVIDGYDPRRFIANESFVLRPSL